METVQALIPNTQRVKALIEIKIDLFYIKIIIKPSACSMSLPERDCYFIDGLFLCNVTICIRQSVNRTEDETKDP